MASLSLIEQRLGCCYVGTIPSLRTHLLSCQFLWGGYSIICPIIVDACAPEYFIDPDRIFSKFLLHFFWRAARSVGAQRTVLMAAYAPRLMDLEYRIQCPILESRRQWVRVDAYRRSPTVETSNLSAMACPSLPPRNLICLALFEDAGQLYTAITWYPPFEKASV
jgi:hypothetical protein